MHLVSLKYHDSPNNPNEWKLDYFTLGKINLLVGRNASGKSRTISIINSLARLLCGIMKEVPISGFFDTAFQNNGDSYHYILEYDSQEVQKEELFINDDKVLHRGGGGMGKIRFEETNQMMKFQTPPREVAVAARRDSVQHPFLKPLHDWGDSLRHFPFGLGLGHHVLGMALKGIQVELDDRDTNQIVPIFFAGVKQFGDPFKDAIKTDMKAIGYVIEDINIQRPTSIIVTNILPSVAEPAGLSIKEKELPGPLDQYSLSQGMFRSLSLLTQLNYGLLSKRATCILVDDIGEGLDFERSCALIDLLRKKAQDSSIQLTMSTNDRFVMNKVPLEEWCLLQRNGNSVRVRNYQNSKVAFDRFKITGLNNFDFLATDFIDKVGANGQNGNLR